MATLQQTLYQKFLNMTKYAHDIVYKGQNDRNRYQLSETIFVRYEGGLITHIFNTEKNIGLKLQMVNFLDADLVIIPITEMGPKGFYVDVQTLMPAALKIILTTAVIQSYERTKIPLINQIGVTFNQLVSTIK